MKRTTALIVPALLLVADICRAESQTETDIRCCVVRILATQRYPNLLKPWLKQEAREIAGTGAVIDGSLVVVSRATKERIHPAAA
jgi:hypothetical protein